jgi:hypothetical protein
MAVPPADAWGRSPHRVQPHREEQPLLREAQGGDRARLPHLGGQLEHGIGRTGNLVTRRTRVGSILDLDRVLVAGPELLSACPARPTPVAQNDQSSGGDLLGQALAAMVLDAGHIRRPVTPNNGTASYELSVVGSCMWSTDTAVILDNYAAHKRSKMRALADPAQALNLPLHHHLMLMAQHRGDLVRHAHQAPAQTRRLPLRRRPAESDQHFVAGTIVTPNRSSGKPMPVSISASAARSTRSE